MTAQGSGQHQGQAAHDGARFAALLERQHALATALAEDVEEACPLAGGVEVHVLQVKAGMKYRGARLAWYERMVELEGKTRDEVTKNLEADPPALYGPKSKNEGKAEPVAGWVRFFERTGVASFQ